MSHVGAERVADEREHQHHAQRAERQCLERRAADAPGAVEIVGDAEQLLERAREDGDPAADRHPDGAERPRDDEPDISIGTR